MGFALLGFWLIALVYRAWRLALVGFVAVSGFDVLGWISFEPLTGAPAEASIEPEGVEFLNGKFVYPSHLASVADALYKSIGVWLVTSMALWLIYDRGRRVGIRCMFRSALRCPTTSPVVSISARCSHRPDMTSEPAASPWQLHCSWPSSCCFQLRS